MRGVDHGAMNHEVVVDKLGGPSRVGVNPSDRAGYEENIFGPIGVELAVDSRLVAEVQFAARSGEDILEAFALETANYGRSHQAGMTGNKDSG